MRLLIKILFMLLGLVFLSAIHIGFTYLLPYPFSKINIIFSVLIITMLWWDSGLIVWLSFFCHLFIELFTVSPFGLVLFSSTIGMLVAYWFYKYIFTNRSWYAAAAVVSLSLIIYRLIYILLAGLLYLFGIINYLPWKLVFATFFWEFIFSVILVSLVYLVTSRFNRRFQASVIESSLFHYEKK